MRGATGEISLWSRTRLAPYAYRRFGKHSESPLLCLQHFTGTFDNWYRAVIDPLSAGREVILFDNARGGGRSTGSVPDTIEGMAEHVLAFLDGLRLPTCDVLGYSLGGMIAQVMAQKRPSILRRMILVGTAPRGGEDIMHLDKPEIAKHLSNPLLRGYAIDKVRVEPLDHVAEHAFLPDLVEHVVKVTLTDR